MPNKDLTFAEKLKEYRDSLNMTQDEFASKTQISRGVVSMIEAGKRPPSKNVLEKLSQFSGKSIDWWYGKEDKKKTWGDLSALNTLLDYMIEQGKITDVKNIDDKTRSYIWRMLEAEMDNKIKNKNTGSVSNE